MANGVVVFGNLSLRTGGHIPLKPFVRTHSNGMDGALKSTLF